MSYDDDEYEIIKTGKDKYTIRKKSYAGTIILFIIIFSLFPFIGDFVNNCGKEKGKLTVSISETNLIMTVGESKTLFVSIDNRTSENCSLYFKSNNTTIATVSYNKEFEGLRYIVTGINVGIAIITFTCSNSSGESTSVSCTVTVEAGSKPMNISQSNNIV